MTSDSKDLKDRITRALTNQEQKTVTILSSLLAVQDDVGYVPNQAIDPIAELTGSTVNDVWGVASFYTNLRFTPPGDSILELCWGPSCHVQGAMKVIKEALNRLGLESEGDTSDGKITVQLNTCLGACSQGPAGSIDHHLVGRLTPSRVVEILDGRLAPDSSGAH